MSDSPYKHPVRIIASEHKLSKQAINDHFTQDGYFTAAIMVQGPVAIRFAKQINLLTSDTDSE